MPAACSLSGRLSTRNASTTMSWVDDIAATSSAPSAMDSGERTGSVSASSRMAMISSIWENTSQPRRRPNRRVNSGTCSASTSGAHRNFNVYGVPTRANSPMVRRSTPDSRIHTSSVEPESASGSPEEKPSSSTISTRRCRYTAMPSRQEGLASISGMGSGTSGLFMCQC